jgi:hypothetical protein
MYECIYKKYVLIFGIHNLHNLDYYVGCANFCVRFYVGWVELRGGSLTQPTENLQTTYITYQTSTDRLYNLQKPTDHQNNLIKPPYVYNASRYYIF